MSIKSCLLSFILFITLPLVVILQFVGLIFLFDTLCASVPEDRDYCNVTLNTRNSTKIRTGNSTGNSTETITSPEEDAYFLYHMLTGFSTISEFLALFAAFSRVLCCVALVCVPCCYHCWKVCFGCGNGWIVLLIIGVIIGFAGQIVIGVRLPVGDVVPYIRAFKFNLSSLLIGVFTVVCWFIYVCKYGCPPEGYFLGSDAVFSDYEIVTESETERVKKTDQYGNVRYDDREKKRRFLRRIEDSTRTRPLETLSHI